MTHEQRMQHHYDEMVAWGGGTKSYTNIYYNAYGNTAEISAAIAVADAAETAKHAAIVMALAAMERA